jgi:thiol:disulfide interchange protein
MMEAGQRQLRLSPAPVEESTMLFRNSKRRTPAPRRKAEPLTLGPMIGMALVCLLGMGGMFLWTSRHATQPVAAQSVSQPTPSAPAFTKKHIYSETAHPTAEIAAALAQAKQQHKRVLLDFGGDWCGDCQVLDIYFHQSPNDRLLADHFVLVHVWIGHMDANLGVAEKYGVPISKGVPALAVLDASGKVVYAQATGEFEDMRHMNPASVTAFLEKWKS